MYLVDYTTFNTFITKNGLDKNEPPIVVAAPFILEYKRDGVMMAKVEMVSIEEFKFFKKYPNSAKTMKSKNKYWIRGDEWKVIDGKVIQALSV
jgi:hypothetical protein